MLEPMVPVYDNNTRRVSRIPARELAPGMILATVEGVEGEVWVDMYQEPDGPILHPPFTGERLARVRRIWQEMRELSPMTLDDWLDTFRREEDPDARLDVW